MLLSILRTFFKKGDNLALLLMIKRMIYNGTRYVEWLTYVFSCFFSLVAQDKQESWNWNQIRGIWTLKKKQKENFYLAIFNVGNLEKEMATHSSVFAWRIPGTGEPGGLPSMESHRVGHDWSDLAAAAAATLGITLKIWNLKQNGRCRGVSQWAPSSYLSNFIT